MLVAFDAIVKGLKPNNEKIPLPIKEPVLEASFLELENSLNSNKEKPFDFSKIYKEKLAKFLLKDFPDDYTGWICIPSQKKDKDGFEDNVEKLKLLSNKNWCTTKTFQAESYLKNGDFQIYFVNGRPELAVRFSGCDIQEIQGERNNTAIPKKYIEELKKHIEDSKYYLNDDVGYIIDLCERGIEV